MYPMLIEWDMVEDIKKFTNLDSNVVVPSRTGTGHNRRYYKNPYKNKKKKFKKKKFYEIIPSYDNKRLGAFEVENYCDCDLFLFTEKMKLNFLKKVFRELKKIQRPKMRKRRQIYKYFYTQCMGFNFRVKQKLYKNTYNKNNVFELK